MDFKYGNCACIAISNAFDLNWTSIKTICKILKIDYNEGLTFWECKKVINLLAENSYKIAIYRPNVAVLEYWQLIALMNKGKYLTVFNEHLSYMENGVLYDTYISYQLPHEKTEYLKRKFTGYWEIKEKEL